MARESVMPACACAALAAKHSFRCVEEAVHGNEAAPLVAGCDAVARNEGDWQELKRCRTCGMHWVEACTSSGQMEVFHWVPVPPGVDPIAFNEQPRNLPFRAWL